MAVDIKNFPTQTVTSVGTYTPVAASTTAVLAAQNAIAAVGGVVGGTPTAPDIARNLKVTFHATWDLGNLTVTGSWRGAVISETFTAGAGTTVVGVKMFDAVTGATAVTSPVKPTGSIVCGTKANYIDDETMAVIDDGTNPALTFKADVAGDGVTGGAVAVNISTDTTAAQVAARLRTAIVAQHASLTITAGAVAVATIPLTHDLYGSLGNVAITENVANAAHVVAGMSGGVGAGTVSIGIGVKIGLYPPARDTTAILAVGGASEAVTVDATAGQSGFTPTSAPDAAKVFALVYNT